MFETYEITQVKVFSAIKQSKSCFFAYIKFDFQIVVFTNLSFSTLDLLCIVD